MVSGLFFGSLSLLFAALLAGNGAHLGLVALNMAASLLNYGLAYRAWRKAVNRAETAG